MKWILPLVAASLAMLATPASAQTTDPDHTCKFSMAINEIQSVKQIPPTIIADTGRVIEKGAAFPRQQYNRGQPVPQEQVLRLVRAGTYQGRWVLWLEGDRYYSKYFYYYKNGIASEAYRVVTFTGGVAPDLCARTEAMLGPKARDTSASAAMKPNWNCTLAKEAVIHNSVATLPLGLQNAIGYVADRGEKFELSRASDTKLPTARFIRAGRIGTQWFVWKETGGYMHAVNIAIYDDPVPMGAKLGMWPRYVERVSINDDLTGDPCSRTNLLLQGYPPLPPPPMPR